MPLGAMWQWCALYLPIHALYFPFLPCPEYILHACHFLCICMLLQQLEPSVSFCIVFCIYVFFTYTCVRRL